MRLQQEEMDRKQREIDEVQNAIAEKARIEAEEKQAVKLMKRIASNVKSNASY